MSPLKQTSRSEGGAGRAFYIPVSSSYSQLSLAAPHGLCWLWVHPHVGEGGALINVSFCSFTDYETGIMLHDKCSYTFSLFLSHTHTQSQQGVLCLCCFFKFWLLFLCLTHIFLILMADFQKNRIVLNFCVVVSVMGYQQQFLVGHNRVWLGGWWRLWTFIFIRPFSVFISGKNYKMGVKRIHVSQTCVCVNESIQLIETLYFKVTTPQ